MFADDVVQGRGQAVESRSPPSDGSEMQCAGHFGEVLMCDRIPPYIQFPELFLPRFSVSVDPNCPGAPNTVSEIRGVVVLGFSVRLVRELEDLSAGPSEGIRATSSSREFQCTPCHEANSRVSD